MPNKEETVYIAVSVKEELPDHAAHYFVKGWNGDSNNSYCDFVRFDGDAFCYYDEGEDVWIDFGNEEGISITHWLKLVPLSSIVEERVKELEQSIKDAAMLAFDAGVRYGIESEDILAGKRFKHTSPNKREYIHKTFNQ